jgi:Zn finger protein HypA/HybF involved in hydrogenase expression
MTKKNLFGLAVILSITFFSSLAFSGTLEKVKCDKCNYLSDDLHVGGGMAGTENTVIYCEACKQFYTIPTNVTSTGGNFNIVQPKGKKEFLGEERLVYPCPKCGSDAYAYNGPVCPICREGKLQEKFLGKWD